MSWSTTHCLSRCVCVWGVKSPMQARSTTPMRSANASGSKRRCPPHTPNPCPSPIHVPFAPRSCAPAPTSMHITALTPCPAHTAAFGLQREIYELSRGPVGSATTTALEAAAKVTVAATKEAVRAAVPVGQWFMREGAKAAVKLVSAAVAQSAKQQQSQEQAAAQSKQQAELRAKQLAAKQQQQQAKQQQAATRLLQQAKQQPASQKQQQQQGSLKRRVGGGK